ncbi:hypothetical protein [Foetidibacter luteolus]|uniref:hypothetical protein n=1 Tax=Foetidibacter luteolus TaxID=2608880 RepID=UPI00129AC853|nr:hypothetical protein [Foetidibacter luteolus]
MENILLEEKDNRYIISIDKDSVEAGTIMNFVDQVRVEQLSKKADYDEEKIMALEKEIKQAWWEKNKWWISKGIEDYKQQNGLSE